MMSAKTISAINRLTPDEKREIYIRLIPNTLMQRFNLSSHLIDASGQDLLGLHCPAGSTFVEMELHHEYGFTDPVLYGEVTDTINGQIHVLLYVLNDPESPRFDIDRLPDGTPTEFGAIHRNLEAELAAMQYGLAPGQIRSGIRMLAPAIQAFERFVESLDHNLYFAEPLYYHNAIIFERYGFAYEKGRKPMEHIQAGFRPGGDLIAMLDGSTPFRSLKAANSIRLRSWAIHDGLLGEPFTNVTMYKRIGRSAELNTSDGCLW